MTEPMHPRAGTTGARAPLPPEPAVARSRRVGWIWFAGAITVLAGLFNVIEGLVALFDKDYYVVGPSGLLVFTLTGWGWLHFVVGVLVVLTGIALLTGAQWARVVTVALAGFNALAQLAFLSAYPFWGVIVIALDVLVIWAVIVHGDEATYEIW
ncbi:hypothetical protein DMA12_17870 [Amycolatopsis balhimycina DSM 5908]|uniref:DUF7144 domain-containing protein n=1 Tax=Amycolatopsis balhimycina DSM 5908 TaxID=1081091 RepID=A0A428WL01_AMYBA|nr:hypothetical protein [Amycolatopsis balhimycina]RSM43757.1 hypothetical protein DMA12_17870 [Amycolatopsis balhimycina DSM 5908]